MAPRTITLIDQVPESLLSAVVFRRRSDPDPISIMIRISMIVIVEWILSFVLFKLGIRNIPY